MCHKKCRETVACPTHPCCTSTQGPIAQGFCTVTALPSYIFVKNTPCCPPPHPPSLSYPNLLLWVSAHGVLNPSVSNSCWGQGGIERLNASLQPPEGIPHVSLPPAHACLWSTVFSNPVESQWMQKGSYANLYIQTSLDSMVAAELISVV